MFWDCHRRWLPCSHAGADLCLSPGAYAYPCGACSGTGLQSNCLTCNYSTHAKVTKRPLSRRRPTQNFPVSTCQVANARTCRVRAGGGGGEEGRTCSPAGCDEVDVHLAVFALRHRGGAHGRIWPVVNKSKNKKKRNRRQISRGEEESVVRRERAGNTCCVCTFRAGTFHVLTTSKVLWERTPRWSAAFLRSAVKR